MEDGETKIRLTPIPDEDLQGPKHSPATKRVEAEIVRRLEARKENFEVCEQPEYSIYPWVVASQILRTENEIRQYVQDKIGAVRKIYGDEISLENNEVIKPNTWVAQEIALLLPGLEDNTKKIWIPVYTGLLQNENFE